MAVVLATVLPALVLPGEAAAENLRPTEVPAPKSVPVTTAGVVSFAPTEVEKHATKPAPAKAPGKAKVSARSAGKVDAQVVRADKALVVRLAPAAKADSRDAATVEVDYSALAEANGAEWASRLRLVSLPECALTTPDLRECQGTPLPTTNNLAAGKLATESATAAGLYAATTAAEGPTGSYGVTPLAASATWSGGGSSGDFTWGYDLTLPPVPGGLAPKVALSYSSQSVDGRGAATNNQPSVVGQGFDLQVGSIERRYAGCADDLGGNNGQTKYNDQCWGTDNATLSMAGAAGELIPVDGTTWRLKNDNGMRVQRVTGTANGDDNGESWVVTATDGTRYHFGSRAAATYTVPVYGNHGGEPCNKPAWADSACTQAYKWNLDYVVDTHGNAMTYTYAPETNKYSRGGTAVTYVRGGQLAQIDYGQRDGVAGTAPARVVFELAERCVPGGACATNQPLTYPDTPLDLNCDTATCTQTGPSFWTRKRLSKVVAQVWNGTAYTDVDSWTLRQSFPSNGDGTPASLWLNGITRTGHVGGTLSLPEIVFDGVQMPNRVNENEGPSMNWWRVKSIRNEYGGTIAVTYSDKDCATPPVSPETNTKRCSPSLYERNGAMKLEYFNKYVVTRIVQNANLVGDLSTPVETAYEYVGAPAWHYDSEDGLVPANRKTWSQWRGYGKVRTVSGNAAEGTRSSVEVLYFRGMDGDKLTSGTRSASVTDSAGVSVPDKAHLAGMTRESITYNGVGGPETTGTITDYWVSDPTASRTRTWGTDEARLTGPASVATRTAKADGTVASRTRVDTTYDSQYGTVADVVDRGDLSTAADDRCTRTYYTRDSAKWLVAQSNRTLSVTGGCTDTPAAAAVIADSRLFYDNATVFGTAPVRGKVTRTERLSGWAGATPTYTTVATSVFDQFGRTTETADALGRRTVTEYLTGPTRRKVTNPAGHVFTTEQDTRDLTVAQVDANGKRTDIETDPIGRYRKVWQPGRRKGIDGPNVEYQYAVNTTKASVVSTLRLAPDGSYVTSHVLYDGLIRQRQSQAPSPAGGRVVTDTVYDSRNHAVKANAAYWNTAPAGTELVVAADSAVPSQTRTAYDGAGRVVSSGLYSLGVKKSETLSAYDGDQLAVTPPTGDTATTTVRDVRGRVTELRQHLGATPTGPAETTRYGYDQADRLTSVTTPAGRVLTTEYDLLGRKTKSTDPARGTSTIAYDAAGQVVSNADAEGRALFHTYDAAGRKTATREGSETGPLRASWVYDTLAKGQVTSATRHVGTAQYVLSTQGYDDGYRPTGTQVTVPSTEGALAGTYPVSLSYTATGQLASSSQPAVGGLPAETLTHAYDLFGNPTKLEDKDASGAVRTTYIRNALYAELGKISQLSLGATGKSVWLSHEYDPATGRLTRMVTDREASGKTQGDTRYTYDQAGNVTSVFDTPSSFTGVPSDFQCFRNDHLRRLTEAWTATSAACGTPVAPAASNQVGYWASFAYDNAGNRSTSSVRLGSGKTDYAYTYPAGGDRLSSVVTTLPNGTQRTDAYAYDDAGYTTTRGAQQLTWDAEGKVTKIQEGANSTEFVYDADGNRLLRRDPTGVTLYVGRGMELKLAGGTVTGTRYYGYGAAIVGMRTGGVLSWLSTNHQASATMAFRADTLAVTRRRFLPFGGERGPAVTWPDDKGFLGLSKDSSTGLNHLGAREFDANTGRFLSPDPVFDISDPQQLNGYTYANNNPITLSDPTGRIPVDPDTGRPVNEAPPAQRMSFSKSYMNPPPVNKDPFKGKVRISKAESDASVRGWLNIVDNRNAAERPVNQTDDSVYLFHPSFKTKGQKDTTKFGAEFADETEWTVGAEFGISQGGGASADVKAVGIEGSTTVDSRMMVGRRTLHSKKLSWETQQEKAWDEDTWVVEYPVFTVTTRYTLESEVHSDGSVSIWVNTHQTRKFFEAKPVRIGTADPVYKPVLIEE
ncbi:RHS repeat-associated core domain-containing protein [Actinokineospora sp. HUAS TT18]|uniref:RHS repeat-associated core domain-containing protein n=1 Tax=Actinokineospora sp. HUAS TT18 TaxID=3447451 RepID=UPI003F5267F8